ncbi:MAG: hypothetical protein KGQ59_01595 [Bdellovibrionales bacterium]|nr:hypothetical protein [Bdellovibrionales bacterium]
MSKLLLRLANLPLFILLACGLLALQSSLFISFPLNWLQPDLLISMVIWVALKREFSEGGILTLLVAHIAELHSSAPKGLFLASYMSIFLGVRLATRVFVLPDFRALIKLTLIASVSWKLIGLLILAIINKANLQWKNTLIHLLSDAFMTGLCSIWLYKLFLRLDQATHKDARLEQRLTDDLKLAENEGI